MGNKSRKGDSNDAQVLNAVVDFDDSEDAVFTAGDDMRNYDSVGAQLITEDIEEDIPIEAGDSADQATDTLAFAGFDFSGLSSSKAQKRPATTAITSSPLVQTEARFAPRPRSLMSYSILIQLQLRWYIPKIRLLVTGVSRLATTTYQLPMPQYMDSRLTKVT
jgi:hypothetical protein